VNEPLNALAFVGLSNEEVAFRIDGEIMRAVELSGPVPSVPERFDDSQRAAFENVDLLVGAIDDEREPLIRIGREADVPHRSAAEGLLRDEGLPDERAFLRENLQPVVRPVAHIDQTIAR